MQELYDSIKNTIIERILILSDGDSKFQVELLYKSMYEALLSKCVKTDIFTFNHYIQNGSPSIQGTPDVFIMNLPYKRDERGRLICNTQIIINSDVIIKIQNCDLIILKHRTASNDLVHRYTHFDISFLSLIHKFLHIRKNIYM